MKSLSSSLALVCVSNLSFVLGIIYSWLKRWASNAYNSMSNLCSTPNDGLQCEIQSQYWRKVFKVVRFLRGAREDQHREKKTSLINVSCRLAFESPAWRPSWRLITPAPSRGTIKHNTYSWTRTLPDTPSCRPLRWCCGMTACTVLKGPREQAYASHYCYHFFWDDIILYWQYSVRTLGVS